MDIQEALKLKQQIEGSIKTIVDHYNEQTGLTILDIELETFYGTDKNTGDQFIIGQKVQAKIQL